VVFDSCHEIADVGDRFVPRLVTNAKGIKGLVNIVDVQVGMIRPPRAVDGNLRDLLAGRV
jgi:hypothetical protein